MSGMALASWAGRKIYPGNYLFFYCKRLLISFSAAIFRAIDNGVLYPAIRTFCMGRREEAARIKVDNRSALDLKRLKATCSGMADDRPPYTGVSMCGRGGKNAFLPRQFFLNGLEWGTPKVIGR